MAYALKFVAGSGYAQNTTAMVKPTGDAYLEIDVKFDNIVSGMTTYLAWVGGSSGSQRVYLSVNFNDNIGFAGRGSMVSSNSYKAVTGERHTLRIAFESGAWVGYFDAVEVGRYTNSMSDIQNGGFNFAVNPALTIGNDDFSIVTAKWVDVNTPANNRTYSADASDRSGTTDQPTLTETVSGLDAAGTNFPSFDSSVWVDLGGGSLTLQPPSIINTSVLSNPTIITSPLVTPSGFSNTSVVSNPTIVTGSKILPSGLVNTSVVSQPTVLTSQVLSVLGINNLNSFGSINIVEGTQYLIPVGIDPTSEFGIAEIKNTVQFLNALGITNNTKVGNPIILGGEVVLVNIYTRPITRLIFKKVNRPSVRNK